MVRRCEVPLQLRKTWTKSRVYDCEAGSVTRRRGVASRWFLWTSLQVFHAVYYRWLGKNSRFCSDCIEHVSAACVHNEFPGCTGRLLIKTWNTSSSAHAGDGCALMDRFYSNPARLRAVINCASRAGRSQIRFSSRPALSLTAIEIRIQFVGVWPLAPWLHCVFCLYSYMLKEEKVENSGWNWKTQKRAGFQWTRKVLPVLWWHSSDLFWWNFMVSKASRWYWLYIL